MGAPELQALQAAAGAERRYMCGGGGGGDDGGDGGGDGDGDGDDHENSGRW